MSHSGSFPLHKTINSISYYVIYGVNKPSTISLWHYKLYHAHFPTGRIDLKHCNINVSNKGTILFCKYCCLGKSHIIHDPLSFTMHTASFEVVHIDL